MEELYNRIQSAESYRVLIIPFILMVIDFATGVFNAWATGHLKSYKMREGLNRKFAETMFITVGVVFNVLISLPVYVTNALSFYVVIMELISICENLDKMGVPIPKFIKNALHQTQDKIQNETPDKKGSDEE